MCSAPLAAEVIGGVRRSYGAGPDAIVTEFSLFGRHYSIGNLQLALFVSSLSILGKAFSIAVTVARRDRVRYRSSLTGELRWTEPANAEAEACRYFPSP